MEASAAAVNAWSVNAEKITTNINATDNYSIQKGLSGRLTLNGRQGFGFQSKPSFQAHKKSSPRRNKVEPSSVPISVNNSLVQHKNVVPQSTILDSQAQLKNRRSVDKTESMFQQSSQNVIHFSLQSFNNQKGALNQQEQLGQKKSFFDHLRNKQAVVGKQTQKHTNRSFFENIGLSIKPAIALQNALEPQIQPPQNFDINKMRNLQSEKQLKQATQDVKVNAPSDFQLEPQLSFRQKAPKLQGEALQRVKSPSWTQPNSPNGAKTGTSLRSKQASPVIMPAKKLKTKSLMQGIDLHSQPSLSLSLVNAARQIIGESNSVDDVNGEEADDEVVIGERQTINTRANAMINAGIKSRNQREVKQFTGADVSLNFNQPASIQQMIDLVDLKGPNQNQLQITKVESVQDDDFSQEMGTILSESNEVTKHLMYADAQPISSPARGKINQGNPDFKKILKELQMMDLSDDENILEQTLGKTLTQQKKILQEINSHTSTRIQQYQSPIEIMMSAQPHERLQQNYEMGRNRKAADSALLSLSQSQILQESEPQMIQAKQGQVSASNLQHDVGYKNESLLKLTKLQVTRGKKESGDFNQSETQCAEFSDFEDSKALDEAIDASGKPTKKKSAAKKLHQSLATKTTPKINSGSSMETRRLKAIIPHNSHQTKTSLNDQPKAPNKCRPSENDNMAFQHITSLKEQIKNSAQGKPQQELIMRLSNLSVVSGQVFMLQNYKQLKLLDLRNNRLQDIPGEICTLQQLATLKVDYNYLVALPFSLGNLSELVCLSASQNRLIELPDSLFRHDSKLHTLLVNDNKIIRVQRSLGGLRQLRQLYLHSNNIVELPTSFCQLTKIQEFSLDWLAYIEKTQEELEEMQGIRQPFVENKEQLQTINDQPVSARKYFDSNANETQENLEETKLQLHRLFDEAQQTQRKSARTPLVNKEAAKLGDNFSLSIIGNKKVLKGDKGVMVVKELRLLCKLIDSAQKSLPARRLSNIEHGRLHFVQFLMYFQNLSKLSQVKDFVYRHKKRTFLHQMGLNGHVYLLQASIAVLGMKRPNTSFNINKTDEDNSTALVLALRQKRFEFVKYLLRLPQISTMIYSHKYGLPLHLALQQCEFKLALKLLKRQDQLKTPEESVELDVNVPNEQGNTAMHLVFMNFNQDPEIAALVAKILIKKGANLRAKNKNELGLLHVAVQAGTLKALKFAVDHNEHSRRRHRRPGLQPSDESLFHFNMQAGNNNWTLLHYAIQATNLSTITFLLDCNENIDLTARDSQGRRAIDLCPFSSPIFKSIRGQIQRKTNEAISRHQSPQANPISETDYSVSVHKRQLGARDVIEQKMVFNEPQSSKKMGNKNKETSFLHKHLSARDCMLSQVQNGQFKFDSRIKREGPKLRKAEPNIKRHFESVFTDQTHQTIVFEDADPYDQSEMFTEHVSRQFPYKTIVQGQQVCTEASRQQRLMGDFVYGQMQKAQQNNFLSTSFVDSIEDKGFELYNSQAAAFPFTLIEADNKTNNRFSVNDWKDKTFYQNNLLETATFIQSQPLNVSSDSHKICLRDSQVEIDDKDYDAMRDQDSEVSVELGKSPNSENGENVDDENDHLGSKAFEARVSQWNRQQSTQHMKEKKINQQKLTLAQQIVSAFEDIKAQRVDEDLTTPDLAIKAKQEEESPFAQQRIGLVIEEHTIESESEDQGGLRGGPQREWQSNKKSDQLHRSIQNMPFTLTFWQLESDFEVYNQAYRLDCKDLRNQFQIFAQLDVSRIPMTSGMLLLALNEVQQLLLWRENEAQEIQMKKLIVINSTGRHRKNTTDYHQTSISNYLQRTKSQSSMQINQLQAQRRPQLPPLLSSPQLALKQSDRSSDDVEVPGVQVKSSFYEVNFKRLQQKAYNEDDSMSMFESNNQLIHKMPGKIIEDQNKQFNNSQRRTHSELAFALLDQHKQL